MNPSLFPHPSALILQPSDLIQLLMDRKGYTLPKAVETVYASNIYAALQRPTSGLYSQSSGYVYTLLEEELSKRSKN